MKHKAFTIMELMVVVAILALLVTILTPTMSMAISITRSSLCRNNLHKLGQAFTVAATTRAGGGNAMMAPDLNKALHPYPEAMLWPATPKDAVADRAIFTCPEDDDKEEIASVTDMFRLLEFRNRYGRFTMDNVGSKAYMYITQGGVDTHYGAYTEFMFQNDNNNGQYEMMDFNGWWETDGYVRIYHSGHCWVPASMPMEERSKYPNARGPGYPDRINSDPDTDEVWFRGEPAFGTDGQVSDYRGQMGRPGYKLDGWTPWKTNYGISSSAWRYLFSSPALVLMDYPELIVDLDNPLDVDVKLAEGARHLGKINTLWADGSVKSVYPLDISPRLNLDAWQPDIPTAKPE